MKPPHIRQMFSLIALLLTAGLVVLQVRQELQQEAKDRALISAAKQSDARSITRLLAEGADSNTRDIPMDKRSSWRVFLDTLHRRSQGKNTAPSALLIIFNVACMKIISAEQSPHVPDIRTVRALLEHGADPNVLDEAGRSALGYAVILNDAQTELLLISHGAKMVNMMDGTPDSLFVITAEEGADARVLEAMLGRGADVDARDESGWTALMHAAYAADNSMAGFLLAHHANVGCKDRTGHMALYDALMYSQYHASSTGAKRIIGMLRQAGAQ